MPTEHRDLNTARLISVAGARRDRPSGDEPCPLCRGGREWRGPAAPYAFPNRWPALANQACTVVVHSEEHCADFGSMASEDVVEVLALWGHVSAEMETRRDVAWVLPFENRGAWAGQTLTHPHSQVFGLGELPVRPDRPEPDPGASDGPVLVEGAQVRALVPRTSLGPFPIRIQARRSVGRLCELSASERGEAADLIGRSVRALDRIFAQEMPYHLWVAQEPFAPVGGLSIEIVGLLRSADRVRLPGAVETATGFVFTPVASQEAFDRLLSAFALEPGPGDTSPI